MKRVLFFVLAYVLFSMGAYAQWDLSVHVKGGKGNALEGATVVLRGTTWQNMTNAEGACNFFRVPSRNYILQVSYVGYKNYSADILVDANKHIDVVLEESGVISEEVVITGIRAKSDQPATFTVMQKEDIEKQNFGQDVPYILAMEPSVVTTSDAGTGIGYTAMRVRGLDSKKINVTINGIPYNDPESHGAFWVDIPDISSSVRSIQLQRGLGKSAPGTAAFGASLNLETNKIPQDGYVALDNSVGSYNTMKNTVQAGTGLLNKHWFAEGRFSRIVSDGYIDRASSNLKSYFAQAGYYGDKSIFRLITFGGFEETYQAWWGIDGNSMDNISRTHNWAGYYTDKNDIEHYYDKQIDHYSQNHIQANYIHSFNQKLQFNTILNYTRGKGYFQEFYNDTVYSKFQLQSSEKGDLTGRKWLDNHLVAGNTFVSMNSGKWEITGGFGFSRYFNAKHYGELLWSELLGNNVNGHRFYKNEGNKTDVSPYIKINTQFGKAGKVYLDINYRYVDYSANGTDREAGDSLFLDIHKTYSFLNPIAGISYTFKNVGTVYALIGASHREPTRSDLINNYYTSGGVKPERMYNTEIGLRNVSSQLFYEINLYYMLYRNELIKTGQLDDVGAPVVKNTGKSYRTGVEFNAGVTPASFLTVKGNVAFSKNKTDFADYVNDVWVTKDNVTISYSPGIVAGGEVAVRPLKNIEAAFINKYVGKQYLDNTQDESRILKDYFVSNFRINAKMNFGLLKKLELKFMVNNVFNTKYNSNGYMYGETSYYYPQALRHYLLGLSMEF